MTMRLRPKMPGSAAATLWRDKEECQGSAGAQPKAALKRRSPNTSRGAGVRMSFRGMGLQDLAAPMQIKAKQGMSHKKQGPKIRGNKA